jgi:ribosome maturation factor RimP
MMEMLKAQNNVSPGLGGSDATDNIQQVAAPILWSLGLELVEVSIVGPQARTVVRIFIDKAEGVGVDDCERAHRALSPALDVADPFPHAYTLEVSSPGLDRALKRPEDFRRLRGKRISVKLKEPHREQWRVVGTISDVDEEAVVLALDDKPATIFRCEFGRIVKARQEVTFRRSRQGQAGGLREEHGDE